MCLLLSLLVVSHDVVVVDVAADHDVLVVFMICPDDHIHDADVAIPVAA